MLSRDRYHLVEVSDWNEFLGWYTKFQNDHASFEKRWIFRGERNPKNDMQTTLERDAHVSNISFGNLNLVEMRLINEFRRRAHHYLSNVPTYHDLPEWLSLMQHFGAPTRLLDWTYSPFVAAYFAIERASVDQEKCIIWGIESLSYTSPFTISTLGEDQVNEYFSNEVEPYLEKAPEDTKRRLLSIVHFLFNKPYKGLFIVTPFRLSERATIQQGTHLMPGDITIPFEENLNTHGRDFDNLTRIEIRTDPKIRKDFLINLYRMNINRATLFPGLQGFAESISTRLAHPEILSE